MSSADNESFPRGGTRIISKTENTKRKHEDTLFVSDKPPKAKKVRTAKPNIKQTLTEDLWQSSLKFNGTLTYNKMQDGMIILGCIRHISNLAMQIEFPGLTFGLITINRISDPFTKILTQKLKERQSEESSVILKNMFKLGQLMPAKILSIENTDKGYDVHATINPVDLNIDRSHSSFKKGSLVWACVVSELDHGYELSVGVKNCRVFLPFKNVDESKKFVVGELLYCVVHKAETTVIATTLTVSAKQEHVDKIQLKDEVNLHDLLPGTKVEFIIEEILPHGIKGQFLENCFGYLDETQIFSKINLEKVREGSILSAYVLFVEPITKVTYLTLLNLENLPGPQYELGKIIPSEVQTSISRGLYLTLGKDATGFVTNKRLLNTLPKDANLDIIDAVRKKYPVGSRHSCRILDYNHMQQMYICTFEQKIIKEKIFKVKDLKIGQHVSATIEKIIPNGLIVKTGHIQGFVPNLHLSNVKYSSNIKSKYTIGMSVSARVLNITGEENVIFTLKQGLLDAESCLMNMEDATPHSQFVGFVVQTKISGALIAYFGDVKGWISNKVLNLGSTGKYSDPRDYFFIGQVVSTWIMGFKNEKLQVSLNLPENTKKRIIKVGQKSNGIVTAVRSGSIDVEVGKHKVEATIPMGHLGFNIELCPSLLKTYVKGDEIEDLMCVKNVDIPVMSRRESVAFAENQIKVPKFRDLKKGFLLRCSFEKETDSGIYVSTPISDYPENILISKNNLFNKDESYSFTKHQCVLAKVLSIDSTTKSLTLDAKDHHVISKDINVSGNLLNHTIQEAERIIEFGQKHNWELTQYKIGERIECKITEIDSDGNCWVTNDNNVKGLVPKHLCPSNCKVNTVTEGVILDYNFVGGYLHICCKNDIKQKINKSQGIDIKKPLQSSCMAELLLFTKLYTLGILKDSQCNRQLVYLPLICNESEGYKEGGKLKIVLQRKVANRIIGVPKKIISNLEKLKMVKEKMKTRLVEKLEKKKIKKKLQQKSIIEADTEMEIGEDISEDDVEKIDEDVEYDVEKIDDDVADDSDEMSDEEEQSNVKIQTMPLLTTSTNPSAEGGAILSGIKSFFSSEDFDDQQKNESSSDEESENKEQNKKKKKLTPKERADLAKKEEERLSKIEKELADSTSAPQSAEQFDRLLLANPNSSELWLKYMAMHVATTELEKARTVAKRAIETINMTLVKEKFNIWLALLNLENMYGTSESFEKVFEDAVKFNDSLEVYLNVIKLLATSGKLNEMEEKIKKVRSKEKQNSKMWLEIGQVYYNLGKFKDARNIKDAALKSIMDKKKQFDLIVRFGIMEFQSGEFEQAVANFETILDTFPSKINIWIIYVDQLVKKKKFDCARKVLERAVRQKLAVKSMKTIFQKFINFEEQHGTSDAVEEVRKKAKEYVDNLSRK